ncbi:MAG TPA: hypothetical protein VNT01_07760 [Symbiobacteriaceae bacterium]|nr:hypothetical protein [Symbiobacteriaceae bacterium]
MTLAHWVYVLGAVAVLGFMAARKGVVFPSIVATFAVGWAYKGGFLTGIIGGAGAIYNASIVAAKELFGIILLIAFMVGMLNALKKTGADLKMVAPIKKLMVNGHVAYWVLFGATAIISTCFWPTPAIPLVAAVLMPAAAAAGLSPMGIAVAVTLAGQGMALASDALMRVAPSISAKAAGLADAAPVYSKGVVLTLIVGAVSATWLYFSLRKEIKQPEELLAETQAAAAAEKKVVETAAAGPLAILTVVAFLLVVVAMIGFEIKGGDAGALIGGTAAIIMLIATVVHYGNDAWEEAADRLKEGFGFAMKIMGSIIPIAAFFFLGGPEHSKAVFGDGAPGFLFDLVKMLQAHIPSNGFISAFGVLLVGMLTGIDGSGFAGLPLTGALSGALATGTSIDPSMLAAVGQMGSVWTGGGTIVAWSSLVAVAGFAGVSAEDLARKNFIPVVCGLVIATIVAVLIW